MFWQLVFFWVQCVDIVWLNYEKISLNKDNQQYQPMLYTYRYMKLAIYNNKKMTFFCWYFPNISFFFQDLNREVVQTNTATVSIPKLQFESPPNKGGKNIKKTLSKVGNFWENARIFFYQRTTNFTFLNDFLVVKFGKQSYIYK